MTLWYSISWVIFISCEVGIEPAVHSSQGIKIWGFFTMVKMLTLVLLGPYIYELKHVFDQHKFTKFDKIDSGRN